MSDNITLPREVVVRAVKALTPMAYDTWPRERQEIVTALRKALAAEQPKVSVTLNPDAMRTVSSGDAVLAASSVAVTVSAALAAEQPVPTVKDSLTVQSRLDAESFREERDEARALLNGVLQDIEALRRENERLNAVALQAQNAAIDLTKKNERLREALRGIEEGCLDCRRSARAALRREDTT